MRTEYNLYDNGENPKSCKDTGKARREHAVVMWGEKQLVSEMA